MAIQTEKLEDGLIRTWSDIGMMVERDGLKYDEAIDPEDTGRTYTETDVPIVPPDEEVTESDKDEALRKFGVEV